jgi:extradiol dioxygenase family protein
MYPRHFGITFCDERSFRVFHARAEAKGAVFFRPLFVRFGGRDDEHLSFFLQDPSNNLLEFKHYRDPAMMY